VHLVDFNYNNATYYYFQQFVTLHHTNPAECPVLIPYVAYLEGVGLNFCMVTASYEINRDTDCRVHRR